MIIIKLGGSVIQETLTEINPKIYEFVNKIGTFDEDFCITVGGGKIARLYMEAAKLKGVDVLRLHVIGIKSVLLQAQFVHSLFYSPKCFPDLIESSSILENALQNKEKYSIFVSGAWEAGNSSDYEAVITAIKFGSDTILRISNVDFVYDSDPKKNPNAKKIQKISWDDYLQIIGNPDTHEPGQSYPVDPNAARLAKQNGIKVCFQNLENFILQEKFKKDSFKGTIIG